MAHISANPCSDPKVSAATLTFPAILDDPMVRALMRADHVDAQTLRTDLSQIAANMEPVREQASETCC